MRIRLPESARVRARRPGAALASAALHGVLIALAINATARAPGAEPAPPTPPVLVYHAPPAPAPLAAAERPRRAATADAPAASDGRRITLPDAPVPDLTLPGPIAVDVSLPGVGLEPPTFGAGASGPVGSSGASTGAPIGTPSDVGSPRAAHLVERVAVPLREIRPRYPDALRARGADGEVVARYVVDSAGRVRDGSVEIAAATDSLLASAVRAALRSARFRAAEVGGRPVAQLVEQRFVFTLRER